MLRKISYVAHQPSEAVKAQVGEMINRENRFFNDLVKVFRSTVYRDGTVNTDSRRTQQAAILTRGDVPPITKAAVLANLEESIKKSSDGFPRFRPLNRNGSIRVALNSIPTADLMAGKSGLCTFQKLVGRTYKVRIHCNYGMRETPKWLELILRIDPLLNGANTVKEVHIVRRQDREEPRAGGIYVHRDIWKIEFVVEISKSRPALPAAKVELFPVCEFEKGQLTVLRWVGDNAKSGTLVLPIEMTHKFEKASKMLDKRRRVFNSMFYKLTSWFRGKRVPQPLDLALRNLKKFCINSLLELMNVWPSNRVNGDDDLFKELTEWRRADCEMAVTISAAQARVANLRKVAYKQFSQEMVKMYGVVTAATAKPLASWLASMDNRYVRDLAGGGMLIHYLSQVGLNITDLHR